LGIFTNSEIGILGHLEVLVESAGGTK